MIAARSACRSLACATWLGQPARLRGRSGSSARSAPTCRHGRRLRCRTGDLLANRSGLPAARRISRLSGRRGSLASFSARAPIARPHALLVHRTAVRSGGHARRAIGTSNRTRDSAATRSARRSRSRRAARPSSRSVIGCVRLQARRLRAAALDVERAVGLVHLADGAVLGRPRQRPRRDRQRRGRGQRIAAAGAVLRIDAQRRSAVQAIGLAATRVRRRSPARSVGHAADRLQAEQPRADVDDASRTRCMSDSYASADRQHPVPEPRLDDLKAAGSAARSNGRSVGTVPAAVSN